MVLFWCCYTIIKIEFIFNQKLQSPDFYLFAKKKSQNQKTNKKHWASKKTQQVKVIFAQALWPELMEG